MLNKYLNNGVDKKKTLKAVKILCEFLGVDSLKRWERINRALIHDMYGNNCFRSYLENKVKNISARNDILRQLERLFDYLVMEKASQTGSMIENPFSFHFDKFKEEKIGGTKRRAIPFDIICLLKKTLMENDFQFVKDLNEDFIGSEFNPSRAIIIYLMLSLPLRSSQLRYLDKDLAIQEKYMDGLSLNKVKGIFVNTNKNSAGFFIPCLNEEIFSMIERQKAFVKDSKVVLKEYGIKDSVLIKLLFVNNKGSVVSRESLMKLWKKLCLEVFKRYDVLVDTDLHTLRVSLVSDAMKLLGDESLVGSYLSGQSNDIVGHYYRVESLEEMVRLKEKEKNVGKLLGGIKFLENK